LRVSGTYIAKNKLLFLLKKMGPANRVIFSYAQLKLSYGPFF
jgi:hypothetical protein